MKKIVRMAFELN